MRIKRKWLRALLVLPLAFLLMGGSVRAQNPNPIQDVKVNVGGYRLQFHIVEGKSLTIVFEAGGGDDSSVWRDIVPAVARQTGARMITYDRAGFGQSDANPGPYSITEEVEALERGLKQLQINGDLILVAHSYGGFVATLFAARNTSMVRGVVLIDANLAPVFTDTVVEGMMKQAPQQLEQMRIENPQRAAGLAKLMNVFPETVRTMRNVTLPTDLRVMDIVAQHPPMQPPDDAAWIRVHQDFDRQSPNRRGVIATGSGHNVMRDRPALVIDEIVAMFQRAQ